MRPDERDLPSMFDRADLTKRMAPISVVTALAAVSLMFGDGEPTLTLAAAALVLWSILIMATFLVPWSRLPWSTQMIVPLGFLGGVALLRQAEGGIGSGYALLVLVPVVMIALYGRRVDFVACLVGATAVLIAPIVLIGAPAYPFTEWRTVVVVSAITVLVGFTVQGLVRSMRRQTRVDALTGVANRRALGVTLYAAKTSGRDRAVVSEPPTSFAPVVV